MDAARHWPDQVERPIFLELARDIETDAGVIGGPDGNDGGICLEGSRGAKGVQFRVF